MLLKSTHLQGYRVKWAVRRIGHHAKYLCLRIIYSTVVGKIAHYELMSVFSSTDVK